MKRHVILLAILTTTSGDLVNECEDEFKHFKEQRNETYDFSDDMKSEMKVFCKKLENERCETVFKNFEKKFIRLFGPPKKQISSLSNLCEILREFGNDRIPYLYGYMYEPARKMLSVEDCALEWEIYKEKYNKHFTAELEEEQRYKIFCDQFERIGQHEQDHERGLSSFETSIKHD